MAYLSVVSTPITTRNKSLRLFRATLYWVFLGIVLFFIPVYIVYLLIILFQVRMYPHAIAKAGFYVHAISGSVYFIIGFLQFNDSIRRKYTWLHRLSGLVYYVMMLVSSFGIALICIGGAEAKESAVLSLITFVSYWVYLNWKSYTAIKNGDVERHRKFHIRGFVLSLAIIMVRPALVILRIINGERGPPVDIGPHLKLALWWVFVWAIIFTEGYFYLEDRKKPAPVDVSNGKMVSVLKKTSEEYFPTRILSCDKVNSRTIHLVLTAGDGYAGVKLAFPGEHVQLMTGNGVSRTYSPVTSEEHLLKGELELIIRLIPNGKMSGVLEEMASRKVNSTDVMYIRHLPGYYEYIPNEFETIVMLAGGTGITPFMNLIRSILNNPNDKTIVKLVTANRSQEEVPLTKILKSFSNKANFTWTSRISPTAYSEKDFLDYLPSATTKKVQVMISGPPSFTAKFKRVSENAGYNTFAFGYSDR